MKPQPKISACRLEDSDLAFASPTLKLPPMWESGFATSAGLTTAASSLEECLATSLRDLSSLWPGTCLQRLLLHQRERCWWPSDPATGRRDWPSELQAVSDFWTPSPNETTTWILGLPLAPESTLKGRTVTYTLKLGMARMAHKLLQKFRQPLQ